MKTNIPRIGLLAGLCLAGGIATAHAAIIFQDSFESPPVEEGGAGALAGWRAGGAHGVYRPTAADFTAANPLASPAEGRQCARVVDDGFIVRKVAVIASGTVYTAMGAYGALLDGSYGDWSIQLWAGAGDSHSTFIGQTYREAGGDIHHPAAGGWADNSFSFNSTDKPELVGQNLFILISNYPGVTPPGHPGPVYVDNVRLDAVGPGQIVGYSAAVASDNPIHYYPLNDAEGSATVIDLGGQATGGGTVLGGITLGHDTSPLLLGTAAKFDGLSGSFIDIGQFHPGDQVTVEAWANLDVDARQASYHSIVARWDGSYELDIANDERVNLVVFNSDGTFGSIASSQPVPRASWHHLVATFADNTLTLFIDGTKVKEVPFSGVLRDASGSSTTIMIGATRNGMDPFGFNFKGSIAHVAIYDRALSADRILAHFNAASPPTAPSLEIGVKVELAWTGVLPGYVLQESSKVEGPYTNVALDTIFFTQKAGMNRYYVRAQGLKFYRLFKP